MALGFYAYIVGVEMTFKTYVLGFWKQVYLVWII